jgi:hypothetical protein
VTILVRSKSGLPPDNPIFGLRFPARVERSEHACRENDVGLTQEMHGNIGKKREPKTAMKLLTLNTNL